MDTTKLKKQISCLSHHAFEEFVTHLFNDMSETRFEHIPDAEDGLFYQPFLDSYGSSIHSVYALHSPPLHLFNPSKDLKLDDPLLRQRLIYIYQLYKNRTGYWGLFRPEVAEEDALNTLGILTNIYGIDRNIYEQILIPAYRHTAEDCGLNPQQLLVGSADSFIELNPENARKAFLRTTSKYLDGFSLIYSEDNVIVRDFNSEKCLTGVCAMTRSPYEPVVISKAIRQRAILSEFQRLLQSEPHEAELEDFLVENFQSVFGNKYDRVETQLWLRFPDIDITNRDRRLDIFLRNRVINDWELFEIKRAIKINREYRGVPSLVAELTGAIQQTRNYARTLQQKSVKQHLAEQGIEYFEPKLSIVVGRTPDIPHDQWRWLRASNENELRIVTFDDLYSELQHRLTDRYTVLEQLSVES